MSDSPAARAFGWLLIVLSGLWLLLTGGCTVTALAAVLITAVASPRVEVLNSIGIVLIVGGFGIAPGVLVFLWGRRLARSGPKAESR